MFRQLIYISVFGFSARQH